MHVKQIKWVRFVVAVYVALSLAFLPLLSQQAMAGHHVNDEISLDQNDSGQEHALMKSGSCSEKSDSSSNSKKMNCCDMNCSNLAAFASAEVAVVHAQTSEHYEIDAEQLTSRMVFGLMRPPRA